MTDFNSKLKLKGVFCTSPTFDDNRFSASDYQKAYDLYHLSKDMGQVEWNLVHNDVVAHLKSLDLTQHYADFNYLRDHLKAHDMTLVVFKKARRYYTVASKFVYWAWGIVSLFKPDGSIVRGLLALDNARPGFFTVLNYPNVSWDKYDEGE